MDPLAIQGAASTGWTRSAQTTPADLATVLAQGRVFAGDVLQTMGGGTMLLGVGRLRVPARAQTELQPGRRYLFEVVHSGQPLEVRLLSSAEQVHGGLLSALRSALGAEAPLGALLEELSQAVAAAAERARRSGAGEAAPGGADNWIGELEEHAYAPGDTPQALRSKLQRSGLGFEAQLARATLDSAPPGEVDRIAQTLIGALAELVRGSPDAPASASEVRTLFARFADALTAVLDSAGADARRSDASKLLAAGLQRVTAADARSLSSALAALDWRHWPPWMHSLVVRGLLRSDASHASTPEGEALAALGADLKGQLLSAEARLTDGVLRTALERALVGLEADQLLNLARAAVDESVQWSVPIREGERWSTLHLRVVRDGARSTASADSDGPRRVALEVEFSRTGPVHVDLLCAEHAVTARVLAPNDAVAGFLCSRVGDLEQALAAGGAAARVSVARAPDEAALHSDAPSRSSFFAAQHLMDIEG